VPTDNFDTTSALGFGPGSSLKTPVASHLVDGRWSIAYVAALFARSSYPVGAEVLSDHFVSKIDRIIASISGSRSPTYSAAPEGVCLVLPTSVLPFKSRRRRSCQRPCAGQVVACRSTTGRFTEDHCRPALTIFDIYLLNLSPDRGLFPPCF
jgi:hypothetical protein